VGRDGMGSLKFVTMLKFHAATKCFSNKTLTVQFHLTAEKIDFRIAENLIKERFFCITRD
jgi:hypothetical protein